MSRYLDYDVTTGPDGALHARPVAAPSGGVAGPIPAEIAALIAGLAGPLVRGREAQIMNALLGSLGYFRDPAAASAAMAENAPAINAWLQHLDLPGIARRLATAADETEPGLAACATDASASLPLVGLGIVAGLLIPKLFRES